MMIGAGFLFMCLVTIEKLIVRNFMSTAIRCILRYLARILFAAFLIILGVSRMYFATHFLHQCIIGAVFGICITEAVIFTKLTDKIQLKTSWFNTGFLMAAGVGASYWIVKYFYGNPMESVHLVRMNIFEI
jgi:membrane-associated phospholipid phosphatase